MSGTAPVRILDPLPSTPPGSDAVGRRVALPPGPPIDPFALAGEQGVLISHDGRVLVGMGTARAIDLPGGLADAAGLDEAMAELASLGCDDRVPEGSTSLRPVLAFGALPFDRVTATSLLVPETLYCREADGTEWVTVLADPGSPPGDETSGRTPRIDWWPWPQPVPPSPRRRSARTWCPGRPMPTFEGAVATVVEAIGRHEVAKVVLARRVDVALDRDPDLSALLRRWGTLEPNGTLFSLPTPDGQFVGASPELLVERHADHVRARPLAGTTDRFHDASSPLPSELLESTKDAEEHRLVVQFISDALGPWCDSLDVPDRPELVHLHNLTHLGTSLEGTLGVRSDGTVPSALHLAALLHPTPAVGGVPRAAALGVDRAVGGRTAWPLCRSGRVHRRGGRRPVRGGDPGHDGGRSNGHPDRRCRRGGRVPSGDRA